MFLFYLRGKIRRGDGGHVLGAQVLRGWGSDKGLCPLGSRDEGSFVTVKLDRPPFLGGVPLSRYTSRHTPPSPLYRYTPSPLDGHPQQADMPRQTLPLAGRHPLGRQIPPCGRQDGHCSGWYASY